MATLVTVNVTSSTTIISEYVEKLVFCVYGSGANGSIPAGVTYTLQTAIDPDAFLMDDTTYNNYANPCQDIAVNVGIFAIKIIGTMPAGQFITVQYMKY